VEGLFDVLNTLQAKLRQSGIESAAIGALALSIWGKARLTRDVDVKVAICREEADRLLNVLLPEYTPIADNPKQTLEKFGMLFFRDKKGTRIDILLAEVEFDMEALERLRKVEVRPGVIVNVCAPEDLIIYKLISTRLQDHVDAQSVIRRQGSSLEEAYILNWLEKFEMALDDSTLIRSFLTMQQDLYR
jgi:hypothetical protein